MKRLLDHYCRLIEVLLVALLAVVVLVFGNVVLRYAFNSGITASEELSRWMFVWTIFLGAIVAIHRRGHLGTDVLVGRLGPSGKKACALLSYALMLWVTWLLFKGSWQQAVINAQVTAPVTGAPVAIVYVAALVFAVSAGAMIVGDAWLVLSGRAADEDLLMVQESEDLAQARTFAADPPERWTAAKPELP
jgi:TRAP-type C4-dicarboxylate transport system permease small subunit